MDKKILKLLGEFIESIQLEEMNSDVLPSVVERKEVTLKDFYLYLKEKVGDE